MKRSWILAALALLAAPPVAHAAPDEGNVTSISVLPSPGQALVVIDVTGAVNVSDFTLNNPARLVVDVQGASLSAPGVLYDGANRGGIINVRYSQFRSDFVRIVIELESLKDYELQFVDEAIRVAVNTDRNFLAWSSGQLARQLEASLPVAAPTPARAASPSVMPAIQQSQQPRITVSFDSTHISDVVAGFASFSGRSIIVGEGIDLVIRSTQIIDQPWDVAFNEILMANGLRGVEQASGVIMVQAPNFEAARDSLEPKRTVVYSVNYKSAPSLAPVLAAVVESRGGSVIADSSSNSLIITDARNRIEEDTLLLVSLDRPTAQVTIQAKLVFVDRTDIEALGVRYDLGDRGTFFNELVQRPDPASAEGVDVDGDGTTDFTAFDTYDPETKIIDLSGNSLAALGNAGGFIANPALELIFSTAVGNFDLTMFVEALQEFQLADLQAEPLIQTADNTPASILVGERTPVRVIDAGSQGGQQGGQQPRATVQFEETGIRLDVTPHVTNTNQVLMTIHAENSSVRVEAAVDLGFTFQTQEADNQILVNDGETAVIGGLTVTEVTVTKQGLPLLSDLPIIGNLFGFTRREEQRRDLLILVTPRVIQPTPTN